MELNPFSYEFHADPYSTYRWLREQAPLYHNPELDFFALSRFRDVLAASQDWRTYSSVEGVTLERMDWRLLDATPMMLFLDPPRHDRLRQLVSSVFTPRQIAALEPSIRATARTLLDDLERAGGGDYVRDFAAPLPMEVIFTMLGVPTADRRQLRSWMDLSLERDHQSPEIPARALGAGANLTRYWFGLLAEMRRQPRDGLMSALIGAETVDGNGERVRLTEGEIIGFCALIGGAGNETVTKLLGNATMLFWRHPEQYQKIVEDLGRIPNAVEEVLRYTPPSQYQARTLTADAEWYGQTVATGARILLLTGAANRDPREFADPESFDIERQISVHIGFGYGIHFCLGAALARLESRVALEEFSQRFPRYEIDESRCTRVHMSNVHGYESMPFVAG